MLQPVRPLSPARRLSGQNFDSARSIRIEGVQGGNRFAEPPRSLHRVAPAGTLLHDRSRHRRTYHAAFLWSVPITGARGPDPDGDGPSFRTRKDAPLREPAALRGAP